MLAITDLLPFVVCLDVEEQAAIIYLYQLSGCSYLLSNGRCCQVSYIDASAYGDLALVERCYDDLPRDILHQADHHWRTEDRDAARSDRCSRLIIHNGSYRFTLHA